MNDAIIIENNLYTIEDNKFKIHSETIKLINQLYTTNSEPVLVFGEPISEQYEINYLSSSFLCVFYFTFVIILAIKKIFALAYIFLWYK